VANDTDITAKLERKWGLWGNGVRLVVLDSPYRLLLEPLLEYIKKIATLRQPNETLTIVVPQFVPRNGGTSSCTPRRRCCCGWPS
jgi:hypothetical protein